MNKKILGFVLVACLHAKIASGMVAVITHPDPSNMTTQALYDNYKANSGVQLQAADRIRLAIDRIGAIIPTIGSLYTYLDPMDALRLIEGCPAANRTELLQLLVLTGIFGNSALDNILHRAVSLRRFAPYKPIINNLLEVGANASLIDTEGNSLLHIAVAKSFISSESAPTAVKILLEHRANPNALDRDGYTPLHRAILNNEIEKARELVEGNADINLTTPEGDTALHLACNHITLPTFQNLIKSILARADADIRKKNHKGLTPLHIIRKSYTYIWQKKEEIKHIDFSPILNKFAPDTKVYQNRAKFARVVRELEDIDEARLELKCKEQEAAKQNKAFLQSTEFKATAAICLVAIVGKLIHSKLLSIQDERAQLAMKTILGILETKSSTTKDLEAFYTPLTQTAEVGTLTSNLRRLFEASELRELSEEMQLIANHQQKKLYKELKAASQEHTAFFGVWQNICKVLNQSAHREKRPDTETSDAFVSEVCSTVSTISEAIKTITKEK